MARPLVGVTIDCHDLPSLAAFWRAALGFHSPEPPEPAATFHTLFAPDKQGLHHLTLQRVPEPKRGKVRIHLDLFAADVAAEVDGLVALGATVVTPVDPTSGWASAVLADPEGHEFCVAQRS